MAYASASDVAARWGKDPESLDDATTALIDARLGDVERLIKRRLLAETPPRVLADDVTNAVIDVDDLVQVEADAVLRLARNPEGYQSETDGDYTYMFKSSGDDDDCLTITPSEWVALGLSYTGMFVIVPTPILAT